MNLVVLVVVLFYSAHAQNSCVKDAVLKDGKCVCSPGFVGNGAFCCVPDDHDVCMVIGDPIVHTMNGDLIPLDLPCVTLVSEVHTSGAKWDETVHVYVAGDYNKHGILSYDYFRVEYWERLNNIHTEIEIYNGDVFIDKVKHNDSIYSWNSSHHEVAMTYNPDTGRFTMFSMATTRVDFIRPNPTALSTIRDSQAPGVCVAVSKDALLYDVGICNERVRGLKRSALNKGFPFLQAGVVEHMLRNLPTDQPLGVARVKDTCQAISSSRTTCGDQWNKAVKSCFVLVSNADIRYCLAFQNVDILDVFSKCIQGYCGLDAASCDYMSSKDVTTCVDIKPGCTSSFK